jgi:hypothetical protein
MERRRFIKFIGTGAVATPLLTISALAQTGRKPKELPTAVHGQVLTSQSWNDLVSRVNQISEQVL